MSAYSEEELIEVLCSLEKIHSGYYGIIFYFSSLQEINKSDFQLKIAANIISDFFQHPKDSLFICKNKDIVLVIKNDNKELLEKIIYQVRYLFADDILAFESGIENPDFCSVFMLDFQWREFINHCSKYKSFDINKGPKLEPEVQKKVPISDIHIKNSNLFFENLHYSLPFIEIEQNIKDIDIAPTIRTQKVFAIIKDKSPKQVFNDLYISQIHLLDLLDIEHNILEQNKIRRYLLEFADKKIMELLIKDHHMLTNGAFSLNFSINSITIDEFEVLDKVLEKYKSSSIIINFEISDVFSEMQTFIYIKQYLKNLNYKLCLSTIDPYCFTQINREKLGFDLIRLDWNPEIIDEVSYQMLENSINNHERNRVILSQCDEKEALDFGKNLGIYLFQGYYFRA